jgi:hypothetical protein
MLVNAFSYLPVIKTEGSVKMLSDAAFAKWLRQMDWNVPKSALVWPLQDVIDDPAGSLELREPTLLPSDTTLTDLAKSLSSKPTLLHAPSDETKIVGLISAFDLL